ncbi:MAG: hypothetical protein GTO02_06040, partial [Candidatus Dadabacteria bacterium]|nr:hypothetical protein [Candidatus Dadabacteria bacterium]
MTFVVPHNPKEPVPFRKSLEAIPKSIGSAKIEIIERKNIGLSYGSFSSAFNLYGDQFEYYIFLEDDYIFVEDQFDEILINIFNQYENCGYLASLVLDDPCEHPAIFNG